MNRTLFVFIVCILPYFAQATAQDFEIAKKFMAQTLKIKMSHLDQAEYNVKGTLRLKAGCVLDFEFVKREPISPLFPGEYVQLNLITPLHGGKSFRVSEKSILRFHQNKFGFIEGFKMRETVAYDCETQGCSQEGEVESFFLASGVSTQSYVSTWAGKYFRETNACEF